MAGISWALKVISKQPSVLLWVVPWNVEAMYGETIGDDTDMV